MAGPLADEGMREARYRQLVRRVVRSGDDPSGVDAELLRLRGRPGADLARDVALLRERHRLLEEVGELPDLELRCELAEEGYRLLLESGAQARAEANAREAPAREAWRGLRAKLRRAREAEQRLRAELPSELALELEQRRLQLAAARTQLSEARRAGVNLEYPEAAVEQALLAWRRVRDALE